MESPGHWLAFGRGASFSSQPDRQRFPWYPVGARSARASTRRSSLEVYRDRLVSLGEPHLVSGRAWLTVEVAGLALARSAARSSMRRAKPGSARGHRRLSRQRRRRRNVHLVGGSRAARHWCLVLGCHVCGSVVSTRTYDLVIANGPGHGSRERVRPRGTRWHRREPHQAISDRPSAATGRSTPWSRLGPGHEIHTHGEDALNYGYRRWTA